MAVNAPSCSPCSCSCLILSVSALLVLGSFVSVKTKQELKDTKRLHGAEHKLQRNVIWF